MLGNIKEEKFCHYFEKLCKDSLVTGFPVIAITKSINGKVIKALVFILCLTGFVYQTWDFLNLYLSYPTTVEVETSSPTTIEMPAITLCNKNNLKRKLYCTKKPNMCDNMTDRKEFCNLHKTLCHSNESAESIMLSLPKGALFIDGLLNFEDVEEAGLKREDLILSCKLHDGNDTKDCSGNVDVYAPDFHNYANRCFAVESLWEKPEGNPDAYNTLVTINIKLDMHPEEYITPEDRVQCFLSVHDSFSLVNPLKEGVVIETGKMYNVHVSKKVKELLEQPYKTNCRDYLKIWRKNGGTGPINQKMCIEKCKLDSLLKEGSCIDSTVLYPHNETACRFGNVAVTPKMMKKCSEGCQPACMEQTYIIRIEEVEFFSGGCKENDYTCLLSKIELRFLFNRMEVTKYKHSPKYESVELFSYIGGYMGMWLGISLIALFDFLHTIALLVCFPFRNKKKNTVKRLCNGQERCFCI